MIDKLSKLINKGYNHMSLFDMNAIIVQMLLGDWPLDFAAFGCSSAAGITVLLTGVLQPSELFEIVKENN